MPGVELGELSEVVTRARDGDEHAWSDLVDRYLGLVQAVCRAHGLDDDRAAEVNQVVWLRFAEHLDRIRTPEALGGWIAATTRHECLRVQSGDGAPAANGTDPGVDAGIDTGLLVYRRDRAVLAAFERLSPRCQRLLRLLMTDPPPSDGEIAAALDMPVGTVGPTRARCLERLGHLVA
jgi:DNA-directed RNA polymerase specialized sigma24 family protein